jgi:phospholipase/carboxylesterase
MNSEQVQIGDLRTVLIGQQDSPKAVVILCHGYGAPGDDLVGIGQEVLANSPELADSTLWAFPEAPLTLDGMYGRAWWELNVAALMECVASGEFASMEEATPPGIADARRQVTALADYLVEKCGISYDRLVLGGFSQGAMISTDVALHMETKPGLLVVFSGALICRDAWNRLAAKDDKLSVIQSHGEIDPVLAPDMGASLRKLLEDNGHSVNFHTFMGGHTIPMPPIKALIDEVQALVSE